VISKNEDERRAPQGIISRVDFVDGEEIEVAERITAGDTVPMFGRAGQSLQGSFAEEAKEIS